MKNRGMLLLLIIIFLVIASSLLAMAATELSVYPEESNVAQDDEFLISVNIDTTEDVIAAQFDITFDPLVINALSAVDGGFLTKDGDYLMDFTEINNTLGKIEVVLVKGNTYTGVTGEGSIVNITFKAAVKNGVSDILLKNIIIPDTTPSAVEVSPVKNGTVNVFDFALIELKGGWNLISIPLLLENMSLKNIFEDINYSRIFTYTDKTWQELDNDSLINETIGLWVKMLDDDNLELIGAEIENTPFDLKEGWNLIGYPLEEKDISELFGNDIVYSYNGSWSSYIPGRTSNSLQKLKPGYGYWVNAG